MDELYAMLVTFITVFSFIFFMPSVSGEILKYTLNDGNLIPAVALGTSLGHLKDGTRIISVNQSLANAVQWALRAGYRHIDTASLYRTEYDVGLGIRNFIQDSKVKRGEIFVTTKLWNDAHEFDNVIPALQKSLDALQLNYTDLYLMHYPMAFNKDGSFSDVDYLETWKGMEEAKKLNLTRSIGISNFNLTQLIRLYEHATIKPAVIQIEVNPSITETELVKWCQTHNIVVMAYSPFGAILGRKQEAPGPKATDPVLQHISGKYNKTVPQILLRYLLDRSLVAIPRSTNKKRIEENISIFDFSLTPEEVFNMDSLNVNYRLRTFAKWYAHKFFPFEKKNLSPEELNYLLKNSKED